MEIESEKMDTSSPGSPAAIKKATNCDTEDNSNHSEPAQDPIAITNNSEGLSEDSKTNGIAAGDDESSEDSRDSQSSHEEGTNVKTNNKNSNEKPTENHISDSSSKKQTKDDATVMESQGDESSEEEGSDENDQRVNAKEAVSVNSESEPETVDDSTRDAHSGSENNDVVMVEGNNEVHEIDSEDDDDDCVVTNEQAPKSVNGGSVDSDVEMEDDEKDPLNHNDNVVNKNSKSLLKSNADDSKDNSTVTIVNTDLIHKNKNITIHPAKVTALPPETTSTNLTENFSPRGSSMTDVTIKTNNLSSQLNNAPLLPTLTDDMFVVEAPSFIVPYVYEKPSLKPFREFVDILGRELEEKQAKEEKERLEKEKERLEKEREEKERRLKAIEEKRARGEKLSESDEEIERKEKEPAVKEPEVKEKQDEKKEDKKEEPEPVDKKSEKKRGKRKKKDEDDASWDGESESGSDEEEQVSEDDELSTVVIKDKGEDDIEEIKTIATKMAEESIATTKPADKIESFFDNNLGKFFINIGLNLVQEYVQSDLLRQQKRILRRETKLERPNTKEIESAIKYLSQNLNNSKQQNEQYHFEQKQCKFCNFKTESALILAHHLETPHMKNNVYTCNFCSFEIRSPHDILFHTEAEHNIRSRLERAPAYHQCANCPFEDNGKGKLARHLIACAKKFKPEVNLAPPIDWEPPAKIPKLTRGRNPMGPYTRPPGGAPLGRPPTISSPTIMGRPRGPSTSIRGQTVLPGAPMMRGGVMIRPTAGVNNSINFNAINQQAASKVSHQPSISITPLPRTPQPAAAASPKTQGSFVICEICDGYIKDLEQLRSHMQWIHKVKIHPKMIYNRPPLNCQKCQFRFFTDQGLERHLLGSHGLVTSSMQETANQGKDSGRCPVCGRVYQWKLLNHVAKDHNMTLKPAHLSYKCTVCTATFGMYKQFESHVYSAHSAVGKRMTDAGKQPPQGRIGNSSITIIPSGKAGAKV